MPNTEKAGKPEKGGILIREMRRRKNR